MMKYILSILFLCINLSVSAHEHYMSIMYVVYNDNAQSLEVTLKIFTDDLESCIESKGDYALELGGESEAENADELIYQYLNSKIQFTIDDHAGVLEYLGKEIEMHDGYCYMEFKNVPEFKTISIRNSFLTDCLHEQTNKVNFKYKEIQRSTSLNKSYPQWDIDLTDK